MSQLSLSEETWKVSNHVAGYVGRKLSKLVSGCCDESLFSDHSEGDEYHQMLSRGGLKVASQGLSNFVANAFAILDACSASIKTCSVPVRKAGEFILFRYLCANGFCCEAHEESVFARIIRTVSNIFYNNERKRLTESVRKGQVVAFKKSKRTI